MRQAWCPARAARGGRRIRTSLANAQPRISRPSPCNRYGAFAGGNHVPSNPAWRRVTPRNGSPANSDASPPVPARFEITLRSSMASLGRASVISARAGAFARAVASRRQPSSDFGVGGGIRDEASGPRSRRPRCDSSSPSRPRDRLGELTRELDVGLGRPRVASSLSIALWRAKAPIINFAQEASSPRLSAPSHG
jgi:hypothetical protein